MNKKSIIAIIAILLLTAGAILVPIIINFAGNASRIESKEYWEYNGVDGKVTAAQIAKMFYNNEFASASSSSQKYSNERICGSASKVIQTVFGSNEELCEFYLSVTGTPPEYYAADSCLTVIDNHPVALNFISAEFLFNGEGIQLYFEEKTGLLIGFYHERNPDFVDKTENDTAEDTNKALSKISKSYYETELMLDKNAYSVTANDYLSAFGLLMYSEEPIIEFD